jgi:four helix bundle protein
MAKIESFRDLIVWQKSMDLAERVYRATGTLPLNDLYAIGTQARRSSSSIPTNVAEGFNRHSRAAYRAHVAISLGSHAEIQTQLELLRRLRLIAFATLDSLDALAAEVGRLLAGLWRALSPVGVCYSWMLFIAGCCGLWPVACGLAHGIPLLA